MPELRSGLTQVFRAHHAQKEVRLGPKLEEFIRLAVPDMDHILVLSHLSRAGRDGCSIGEIASGSGAPKGAVKTALERFEKLKLAHPRGGLLARKYTFPREGTVYEMALRLVKLWEHPQSHQSVLQAILGKSKSQGGPPAAR